MNLEQVLSLSAPHCALVFSSECERDDNRINPVECSIVFKYMDTLRIVLDRGAREEHLLVLPHTIMCE